jgi:hypothetical protein
VLSSIRSCRDVSTLVLEREDRNLSFPERLTIRLHFMMCKACPKFEEQVITMRHAMRDWSAYREHDDDQGPQ